MHRQLKKEAAEVIYRPLANMKLNFTSTYRVLFYNDTEAQNTLTPVPAHSATSALSQFLAYYVW